mmetsp:Transcript_8049/g.23058  ORF Transcript_8049/g.23058 Transcript_8049/m.23058 type:complete len:256 (+) Transcript_8049:1170-1937(+)
MTASFAPDAPSGATCGSARCWWNSPWQQHLPPAHPPPPGGPAWAVGRRTLAGTTQATASRMGRRRRSSSSIPTPTCCVCPQTRPPTRCTTFWAATTGPLLIWTTPRGHCSWTSATPCTPPTQLLAAGASACCGPGSRRPGQWGPPRTATPAACQCPGSCQLRGTGGCCSTPRRSWTSFAWGEAHPSTLAPPGWAPRAPSRWMASRAPRWISSSALRTSPLRCQASWCAPLGRATTGPPAAVTLPCCTIGSTGGWR